MTRYEQPCPTCLDSPQRGMLRLRDDDWLECPDCGGTGIFVCFEQRVTPPRHFLVPDLKGI